MFWNRRRSFLFAHSAKLIFFTLIVAILLRLLFLSAYSIQTTAMIPSLNPGEFIIAWKTFVPHRGDVVILECPQNESRICVKRVVGLPGDRIEMAKQRLFINAIRADYEKIPSDGSKLILREKWQSLEWPITVGEESPAQMDPTVVPPDHVFLLNDNRSDTSDSRQWGPIPSSRLEAKAWRIWLSVDWSKNKLNWSRLLQRID